MAASATHPGGSTRPRPVVCFDFDETLAVCTGHAACADPLRLFGGASRLEALRSLLSSLRGLGVACGVCSFNYRAVFEPLLSAAGLLDLFDRDLLLGAEVFEEGGALHSPPPRLSGVDGLTAEDRRAVERELFRAACAAESKGAVLRRLILPRLRGVGESEEDEAVARLSRPPVGVVVPRTGSVDVSDSGAEFVLFVDDCAENLCDVRAASEHCATLLSPPDGLKESDFDAVLLWARGASAGAGGGEEIGRAARRERVSVLV